MKLVVIDPGFHWHSGHHFIVNQLIRAECLRRGIDWSLLASYRVPKLAIEQLQAQPLFRISPYTALYRPILPELSQAQLYMNGNSVTFEDLDAAKLSFDPGDAILVHTITATQLAGIAAWHARLPEPRPRIAVILRFSSDHRLPPEQKQLGHAQFVQALDILSRTGGVLGADSVSLAKLAGPHWPREVAVMPIPLAFDEPIAASGAPKTGYHLAYLGEARPEKGFELLPQALSAALARHADLRITIQCAGCPPDRFQPYRESFGRISSRIDMSNETLPVERYRELIASADGVLVAYDPAAYTYRTSHVFIDALAEGRPVIFTAGTWMANEVERLCPAGAVCGVAMPDFTAEALAQAIDALIASRDRYAAGAAAAMPVVRARHNRRAYLDALFQLLGTTDHG